MVKQKIKQKKLSKQEKNIMEGILKVFKKCEEDQTKDIKKGEKISFVSSVISRSYFSKKKITVSHFTGDFVAKNNGTTEEFRLAVKKQLSRKLRFRKIMFTTILFQR